MLLKTFVQLHLHKSFYFIVSGEINVYLVKIKVVSITSEMILYHFTIVTDTIYIFTLRFGRLRFSSLFQMWILPQDTDVLSQTLKALPRIHFTTISKRSLLMILKVD